MVVTRGAQRALLFSSFGLIAVVYGFAWLAPAIGLAYDDGVNLVAARTLAAADGYAQTKLPPVFPALLALFNVISSNAHWLKLLPLLCSVGWLIVTWKLLRRLGATSNGASFLVAVTAASPTVIFLSTNLLPEPLFALLVTWSLLLLVDGRRLGLAGLLAGMATVTQTLGVALIIAGVVGLIVQRRLSGAVWFAIFAMLPAVPWLVWFLGHQGSLDILSSGLQPAERFRVVALNCSFLLLAPYTLITGLTNTVTAVVTAGAFLWAIVVKRQAVTDLYVAFYCLLLLILTNPPQRSLAPVLPLVLWIVWRALAATWSTEGIAVLMVVTLSAQIFADFGRLPVTRRSGVFAVTGQAVDEWPQILVLCRYLKSNTPESSVVMANLDPVIFLQSGRHAVRGFRPNRYELFYAAARRPVEALELLRSIRESHVDYVAVSPDRDFVEAPGFVAAVGALEREGVVEPVPVAGLSAGYRIWRVTGAGQ